jgi:hypothetical protein
MEHDFLCLILLISVLLNAILLLQYFSPTYFSSNIPKLKYLTRSKLS